MLIGGYGLCALDCGLNVSYECFCFHLLVPFTIFCQERLFLDTFFRFECINYPEFLMLF